MLSDIFKMPNFNSWTCKLFKKEQCPIQGKIIIKTNKLEAIGTGVISWGEDDINFKIPFGNIKRQDLNFKNGAKVLTIKSEDYPSFISFEFYPDYLYIEECKACLIKIDCARAKIDTNFELSMSDFGTEAKGYVTPLLFCDKLFDMYFSAEVNVT